MLGLSSSHLISSSHVFSKPEIYRAFMHAEHIKQVSTMNRS